MNMEENMKKITLGVIFLSMLLASACTAIDNGNETQMPSEPTSPAETEVPEETAAPAEGSYAKSNLERETEPQVTPENIEALSNGNSTFAISFYDLIRQDGENIIFSPLSLSLALTMTMAGAESTTEQAMLEALKLSLPEEEVYPAFNALMLAIEESEGQTMGMAEDSAEGNFQLNIANSIWGQSGYDFKENYLDTLARHFGAGMYTVDYQQDPESARNAINDWIEQETEDKIQDLIPPGAINPLTRLVLANAIYFNGAWLYPFNETGTEEALFTTLDGSEITVDMMKLSGERLSYAQGENVQAVSLPYLSPDFAMTILVPDSGSFSSIEDALSIDSLTDLMESMRMMPVNLQMPKFDFESTVNAKDPLKSLGMAEAFDPDLADFSGITEAEKLFITDVLHKATITVDEEGTEAAAATAVIVGIESAMPDEPISLVIDRPFLFMIRHQPTGTILFMGRVTQP